MNQGLLYSLFGTGNNLYKIFRKGILSRHYFGRQIKYYSKKAEAEELMRSSVYISPLKGSYKGKRCFIIGNGPSLDRQNLKLLKNEFTIGAN